MKRRTKGIMFFAFIAGIMLASGITIAIPSTFFENTDTTEVSKIITSTGTGTPLDNIPLEQQDELCGTGEAVSNSFVTEYKIPTVCSQPLAITTDPSGMVWFVQTNSGNLAKFDPVKEEFTEFDNPIWDTIFENISEQMGEKIPARSMMWGMDYSPDDSIWYTDGDNGALWRFSITDESYDILPFPGSMGSERMFPQKLSVDGSRIIVNDFLGSKLSFFDFANVQEDSQIRTFGIPSPIENSYTADFTIDSEDNIWYTTWIPRETGILVKFDYPAYESQQAISPITQGLLLEKFVEFYQFPTGMMTPNGITTGPNQKIWIADTSGNFFFSFDPQTEKFTKYITSIPHADSYGNLKLPSYSSNPYWIEESDGNLVMNEHNANRIAVFNPSTETLVEYTVPSRNPNWADCEGIDYCGLAQVFGFAIHGKKIWFTEWVENNIGVVDTSILLPFTVDINTENVLLEKGQTIEVLLQAKSTIISDYWHDETLLNISTTSPFTDLVITSEYTEIGSFNDVTESIPIQITASDSALPGTYKVLLGVLNNEIAVSEFITVTIV